MRRGSAADRSADFALYSRPANERKTFWIFWRLSSSFGVTCERWCYPKLVKRKGLFANSSKQREYKPFERDREPDPQIHAICFKASRLQASFGQKNLGAKLCLMCEMREISERLGLDMIVPVTELNFGRCQSAERLRRNISSCGERDDEKDDSRYPTAGGSWQCRKPNEDCVPKKEIDCDGKDAEGEGVVTERFEGPAMDEVKEHASGAAAGAVEAGELIDGAGWEPSGFSGRGEPGGSYDG